MLNPQYIVPMELFSFQHIATLFVIACIFLAVFFSRKFFIRSKWADRLFRYVLAFLIVGSEMGYYAYAGIFHKNSLAGMLPTALCGHLLWIVSLALVTDSRRIMKLFYPMAMTGATLSMLFVNMEASFPHFRAFHYFMIHAGFMLGAAYFLFTKKIVTYKLRDFGWSCFTLLSMASFVFILNGFNLEDSYFLVNPPPGLEFIKESLGQTGYTLLYILSIAAIMGVYGLLAYLPTKKREPESVNLPELNYSKYWDRMSRVPFGKRIVSVFLPIIAFVYLTVLQAMSHSTFLFFVDVVLLGGILVLLSVNELSLNYRTYYKRQQKR